MIYTDHLPMTAVDVPWRDDQTLDACQEGMSQPLHGFLHVLVDPSVRMMS